MNNSPSFAVESPILDNRRIGPETLCLIEPDRGPPRGPRRPEPAAGRDNAGWHLEMSWPPNAIACVQIGDKPQVEVKVGKGTFCAESK